MTRAFSCASLFGLVAMANGCLTPAKDTYAPRRVVDTSAFVVAVHADGVDVDWDAPWGTGKSWHRTLTGLVVAGHRILVGGGGSLHNQRHVEVQKPGATARTPARVLLADEDAGFALLTVDGEPFWEGTQPAILSRAPGTGAVKLLHAGPEGRVEVSGGSVNGFGAAGRYDFVHMMIVQADVQHIGVSDVVGNGEAVTGLIMSTANNKVLAVGSPTLLDFLAEASRVPYRGYATCGVLWQPLTDPALRAHLGLRDDEGGARIQRVWPIGSANSVLQDGDVVLSVGGTKVDNDGTYADGRGAHIWFDALFAQGRHPGDGVALSIVRGGERKTLNLTLRASPGEQDLVPNYAWASSPRYVVAAGLVFEHLTREYLAKFGADWEKKAPQRLVEPFELARWSPSPERPHVVVLTSVLPTAATLGYEHLGNLVVDRVNGVPARTLDDVSAAFAHPAGGYHVVTFSPGQGVQRIVLDVQEAKDADVQIREKYHPGDEG
jgi:PDZ domain